MLQVLERAAANLDKISVKKSSVLMFKELV